MLDLTSITVLVTQCQCVYQEKLEKKSVHLSEVLLRRSNNCVKLFLFCFGIFIRRRLARRIEISTFNRNWLNLFGLPLLKYRFAFATSSPSSYVTRHNPRLAREPEQSRRQCPLSVPVPTLEGKNNYNNLESEETNYRSRHTKFECVLWTATTVKASEVWSSLTVKSRSKIRKPKAILLFRIPTGWVAAAANLKCAIYNQKKSGKKREKKR